MKVMELFESPKHTFPTDFGLDEFDYNVKFGQELFKQYSKVALEKVGDGYTLWEFKREFALIRDEDSYVAYYMKFRFDMINLIKRQCVSQIAIWRSRMVNEQSGMAKRIFMNHLIPKYGNIITDSEQTEDGRRFWADRIRECVTQGDCYVYYVSIYPDRKILDVSSMKDYEHIIRNQPAYGSNEMFKNRRFVITTKPLDNQLNG